MNNPSRIVWRLHMQSAPTKVYQAIATSEGRARFWSESADEVDDLIHFVFISGVQTRSRILERLPPHRFVIEYFDSRVEFDLQNDGSGGTDLTLTNTGYGPEGYLEVLPGWLNVLFPLKAFVDHGIDLRNHDPDRTWVQRFVDQ